MFALPFGQGQRWAQNGAAKWILGGWIVNPIVSWMTGPPFTVGASGALNANGSSQTADLVGNFRLLKGKPPRTGFTCAHDNLSCHYFDPGVFAAPLIFADGSNAHYGNTNRNAFRGPGFFNMNLSLLRDFRVTERVTFTFRADAFGFTNTPHFANPGTSCPAQAPLGALCSTGSTSNPTSADNNFGVVTGTAQPGGFFGPDAGNRVIWLGAAIKF